MANPIFFPGPPHKSDLVTAVLVERIYLPEPRVSDRFGGVTAPTIEAFESMIRRRRHPVRAMISPRSCNSSELSRALSGNLRYPATER
jgi:hypothetical protein